MRHQHGDAGLSGLTRWLGVVCAALGVVWLSGGCTAGRSGKNGCPAPPRPVRKNVRFTIFGHVNKPGIYRTGGPLTIVQAVKKAGGFTESADRDAVVVTRKVSTRKKDGRYHRLRVRVKAIAGGRVHNFLIRTGDVIWVPKRWNRDRDGDRVPDEKDQCPKEPGLARRRGCPEKVVPMVKLEKLGIRLLHRVRFKKMSCFDVPKGRWPLASNPDSVLEQVAAVMKNNPGLCVMVQAHMDISEDMSRYSCPGTQMRADAVRHYLIGKGISPGRLLARGYGADRPLTPKRTKAAILRNTRIEFVILKRLTGPKRRQCWKP